MNMSAKMEINQIMTECSCFLFFQWKTLLDHDIPRDILVRNRYAIVVGNYFGLVFVL